MPFPSAKTDFWEGQNVDNQDRGSWMGGVGAQDVEIVGSAPTVLGTNFVIGVTSSLVAAWIFFELFGGKRG